MSPEDLNTTKLAAAQIVAAFAGREAATVAEVLELAQRLPQVLEGLDGQDNMQRPHYAPTAKAQTPAVAIAKAFSDDKVTSLGGLFNLFQDRRRSIGIQLVSIGQQDGNIFHGSNLRRDFSNFCQGIQMILFHIGHP